MIESEYRINADIAYQNGQFRTAYRLYQKALEMDPDNVDLLAQAGKACVESDDFTRAMEYFERAFRLDAEREDVIFGYANACFLTRRYGEALAYYTKLDTEQCSSELRPRLLFQMGMLCEIRGDYPSALRYMERCESSDPEGTLTMDPVFISERAKIALGVNDIDGAIKYARQWISVQPEKFDAYMLLYSLLMAKGDNAEAERLIPVIMENAVMDEDQQFQLLMQNVAILVAKAEQEAGESDAYLDKAIKTLQTYEESDLIQGERLTTVRLAIAEAYQKKNELDAAIDRLKALFAGETALTDEERDEANYRLMLCYLGKNDFRSAGETAQKLEGSEQAYLQYYSRYIIALAARKTGEDEQTVKNLYDKTIAYFRSRLAADPGDIAAVFFRARMYAEQGWHEKAMEQTELLSDGSDREKLIAYINSLQS